MSVNNVSERDERPAYVKFERVAVEDKAASLQAGHSVSKDVDYALITPPYSKDCVRMKIERWRDTNKYESKMGRLPQKWLEQWETMYSAWKNGQEAPLDGTPIREWSAISPAQIKNLIAIGIHTVEDLAAVNAQGIQRIGMGANELKRKANNWLSSIEDNGKVALKITQLEIEKERNDLTIQSLTEKVNELSARLQASNNVQVDVNQYVEPEVIAADDILDDSSQNPNLREAYMGKFGEYPHHRMKDATIKKKLEE